MKVVGEDTCRDPGASLRHEWLETNGLGGYASSTILNCHTRKYHALLAASLADPPGRFVLLSKFEDSILVSGQEHFLSTHQYPGLLYPPVPPALAKFRLDAGPDFLYRFGEFAVRKRILMARGENTTLIRYTLEEGKGPALLHLKPLLAFREFHCVRRKDPWFETPASPLPNGFSIRPYEGLPRLFIQTSRPSSFLPGSDWYYNFEYAREIERGYDRDGHEDLFCPGVVEVSLDPGESVIVSASTREQKGLSIRTWNRQTALRRSDDKTAKAAAAECRDTKHARTLAALVKSGQRFLIRTPAGRPTLIAGYPWFDDWSRDTLISLPGLTFCSGRTADGVAILKSIGEHERDGLLPNFFAADPRHNAYNSVDASLWYFWAAQQMLIQTNDSAAIRDVCWPVMKRILARYMAGAPHGIFMNEDGLLHAGSAHTQLTWMDATVRGTPVTPRHGYAVEINALWYNALCFAGQLAKEFGDDLGWKPHLVETTRAAFTRTFWLEEEGFLADVCSDSATDIHHLTMVSTCSTGGADALPRPAGAGSGAAPSACRDHSASIDKSVRPNQILAVSLPFSPLNAAQGERVVATVRRELLTPYGLRTLSPRSPAYRGRYEGDQAARDAAYHQGTVWPWLLGHFGEASFRVAADRAGAARSLFATLAPLLDYSLHGAGLNNVPEIFDGDPPHRPNGCLAQAWSTAELIRLFVLSIREGLL